MTRLAMAILCLVAPLCGAVRAAQSPQSFASTLTTGDVDFLSLCSGAEAVSPSFFGLDALALGKWGEFLLSVFPSDAIDDWTVAVLSGLPPACAREYVIEKRGKKVNAAHLLRRVNARRYAYARGEKLLLPDTGEDALVMARYDSESTNCLVDFVGSVYFDLDVLKRDKSTRNKLLNYVRTVYAALNASFSDLPPMRVQSVALFLGTLPAYVSRLGGTTMEQLFEDCYMFEQDDRGAEPAVVRKPVEEVCQTPWLRVQSVNELLQEEHLPELLGSPVSRWSHVSYRVLHRMIATSARYLGLPDQTCISLRKSANHPSSWSSPYREICGSHITQLGAEYQHWMNRLSSEASDLFLRCLPPAAQVLRVASTSTAMDMMLQKKAVSFRSAEDLSDLRESRPAADADLLRLLVELPPIDDVTLPAVFRAREAPLFEVALLAVAERLKAANSGSDVWNNKAARLTQWDARLGRFKVEFEAALEEQGRRGVECKLFAYPETPEPSDPVDVQVFFGCFNSPGQLRQCTATAPCVMNLFSIQEPSPQDRDISVNLVECSGRTSRQFRNSRVSVSYAVAMLAGVQVPQSLRHNRLFHFANGAVYSVQDTELKCAVFPKLTQVTVTNQETVMSKLQGLTKAAAQLLVQHNRTAAERRPAPLATPRLAPATPECDLTCLVVRRLRDLQRLDVSTTDKFERAHVLLNPIRQAYNVTEEKIIEELQQAGFGGGGAASLSGERFAFTEHFVVKTMMKRRDHSMFLNEGMLTAFVDHLVETRGKPVAKPTMIAPILAVLEVDARGTPLFVTVQLKGTVQTAECSHGEVFDIKGNPGQLQVSLMERHASPFTTMQREPGLLELLQFTRRPIDVSRVRLPHSLVLPSESGLFHTPLTTPSRQGATQTIPTQHTIGNLLDILKADLTFFSSTLYATDYSLLLVFGRNTNMQLQPETQLTLCSMTLIDYLWVASTLHTHTPAFVSTVAPRVPLNPSKYASTLQQFVEQQFNPSRE
ncbi:MAG: hypothetical protein MHM6MM_005190 [Cercozoa sp. M6MM]